MSKWVSTLGIVCLVCLIERVSAGQGPEVPGRAIPKTMAEHPGNVFLADKPENIQARIRELYQALSVAIDEQLGAATQGGPVTNSTAAAVNRQYAPPFTATQPTISRRTYMPGDTLSVLSPAPPGTAAEQRAPPHVTLPDHFSY